MVHSAQRDAFFNITSTGFRSFEGGDLSRPRERRLSGCYRAIRAGGTPGAFAPASLFLPWVR